MPIRNPQRFRASGAVVVTQQRHGAFVGVIPTAVAQEG